MHDLRPEIFSSSSPYGLDKSGFTAVKHRSALHLAPHSKDSFLDDKVVEAVYIPETEELVKSVTGAKTVFTVNVGIRLHPSLPPMKTLAEKAANPSTEPERCGVDIDPTTMDLSKPYIGGIKESDKFGPARAMHIDFSPHGAANLLRHSRYGIRDDVGDIIEAEDGMKEGDVYEGRRYALYSVWRPLRPVKRDPVAVCDGRSIDAERDLIEHVYKAPGRDGDHLINLQMLQANNTASQRWYYIKEHQPDEVLFIQFFDSHAKKEDRVVGVPHGSPELVGNEETGLRNSVEIR